MATDTHPEDAVKRVDEIMITLDRYPCVHPDETLLDAMTVIEESHLQVGRRRSLPRVLLVLEDHDALVGIVRRRDIMRGLLPPFLVSEPMEYRKKPFEVAVDPNLSELPFDHLLKGFRGQALRRVREVMQPVTAILRPDDHLMKAVYEMVSLDQSLIPVVEEERVLGVIRSVDVFHELAELL